MGKLKPIAKRILWFWNKVNCGGSPDACWIWSGAIGGGGYGNYKMPSAGPGAHRAAWFFINGPIQENMHVLHKCDNRLCVNPNHLFLGTHQENMADKMRKCRHRFPFGNRSGARKLSESDIPIIKERRLSGASQTEIARQFGVTQGAISRIVNNKQWRRTCQLS